MKLIFKKTDGVQKQKAVRLQSVFSSFLVFLRAVFSVSFCYHFIYFFRVYCVCVQSRVGAISLYSSGTKDKEDSTFIMKWVCLLALNYVF